MIEPRPCKKFAKRFVWNARFLAHLPCEECEAMIAYLVSESKGPAEILWRRMCCASTAGSEKEMVGHDRQEKSGQDNIQGDKKTRQTVIYKRGKFYWYKFMWDGKLVRESTKIGNDKVARQMESAHRTALAKGEVGIREKKLAPTLADFLKKSFQPYAKNKHAEKPNTLRYYKVGSASLMESVLGAMRLDEITDQQAQQYGASHSNLSPSTVNCGLRTLRRALNLAVEWGAIERKPKITLVKGERQRERVLTYDEANVYLGACDQPWRDAATILMGTGMRPGEVFALRWENILMNRTNRNATNTAGQNSQCPSDTADDADCAIRLRIAPCGARQTDRWVGVSLHVCQRSP
jgi:hypothetical protein